MKKQLTAVAVVLLLVCALTFAGCGKVKTTPQYQEFYQMIDGATFNASQPDGYEYFNLYVDKWEDYVDFRINAPDWSVVVSVYGDPSKPLVVYFRSVYNPGSANSVENIVFLDYTTMSAKHVVNKVIINQQQVDSSNASYNKLVDDANNAYQVALPVINDVISQISGGKYVSMDQLRTLS